MSSAQLDSFSVSEIKSDEKNAKMDAAKEHIASGNKLYDEQNSSVISAFGDVTEKSVDKTNNTIAKNDSNAQSDNKINKSKISKDIFCEKSKKKKNNIDVNLIENKHSAVQEIASATKQKAEYVMDKLQNDEKVKSVAKNAATASLTAIRDSLQQNNGFKQTAKNAIVAASKATSDQVSTIRTVTDVNKTNDQIEVYPAEDTIDTSLPKAVKRNIEFESSKEEPDEKMDIIPVTIGISQIKDNTKETVDKSTDMKTNDTFSKKKTEDQHKTVKANIKYNAAKQLSNKSVEKVAAKVAEDVAKKVVKDEIRSNNPVKDTKSQDTKSQDTKSQDTKSQDTKSQSVLDVAKDALGATASAAIETSSSIFTSSLLKLKGARVQSMFKKAKEYSAGRFSFKIYKNEVMITKYIGGSRIVEIPSAVNLQNGKSVPVRYLHSDFLFGSFFSNYNTRQIMNGISKDIDKGVSSIKLSDISEVLLPEGLFAIFGETFNQCSGVTELVIPSTVVYIAPNAFEGSNIMDIYMNCEAPTGWKSDMFDGIDIHVLPEHEKSYLV